MRSPIITENTVYTKFQKPSDDHLLVVPMPWLALLVMLFIASVFVFLAVRCMELMDF